LSLTFLICWTIGIMLVVLTVVVIFSLLHMAQKGDAHLDKLAGLDVRKPTACPPDRVRVLEFGAALTPRAKKGLEPISRPINEDCAQG
jgi:hypothetical protein